MSMKRTLLAFALAAGTSLPLAAQQPRQTQDAFNWSGKVPAGGWIRVVNLNGPITVGTAAGDDVVITATKQWRRGDPAVVHFETRKFGPGGENVLVCALWGERASCNERGDYESRNDRGMRNNDVSVSFRVLVPKGVKVDIRMECDNIEILKKMVEVGLGVSLVPHLAVREEARTGSLQLVRISDHVLKRPLAIVHRKGKMLTRTLRAFIDLLTHEGADLLARDLAARAAADPPRAST